MSGQNGGWEKLLCELPWVWVTTWTGMPTDLGWQVAGRRNKPLARSAKILAGEATGEAVCKHTSLF